MSQACKSLGSSKSILQQQLMCELMLKNAAAKLRCSSSLKEAEWGDQRTQLPLHVAQARTTQDFRRPNATE